MTLENQKKKYNMQIYFMLNLIVLTLFHKY
jgi:hypothetical protein